jgi:hypothetical protein
VFCFVVSKGRNSEDVHVFVGSSLDGQEEEEEAELSSAIYRNECERERVGRRVGSPGPRTQNERTQ